MALMVHDSDPNAAKTCFVHVKSWGQTLFFDPHFLTPMTSCFRGLRRHADRHYTVKAVHVMEILIALRAALSLALVGNFFAYKPHID